MKPLFKNIRHDGIDVLGADNAYRHVPLRWDEHDNFCDRTRDQILATGVLLHLGLLVTGTLNCIDGILEEITMAAHNARLDMEE